MNLSKDPAEHNWSYLCSLYKLLWLFQVWKSHFFNSSILPCVWRTYLLISDRSLDTDSHQLNCLRMLKPRAMKEKLRARWALGHKVLASEGPSHHKSLTGYNTSTPGPRNGFLMTSHYGLLGRYIDVSLQDLTEQFALCVCSQNFNGCHFHVQYSMQISLANNKYWVWKNRSKLGVF